MNAAEAQLEVARASPKRGRRAFNSAVMSDAQGSIYCAAAPLRR